MPANLNVPLHYERVTLALTSYALIPLLKYQDVVLYVDELGELGLRFLRPRFVLEICI